MQMVNANGNNQYGGKLGRCIPLELHMKTTYAVLLTALALDDSALTKLFKQFNREKDRAGLSVEEQLARLRAAGCPMR